MKHTLRHFVGGIVLFLVACSSVTPGPVHDDVVSNASANIQSLGPDGAFAFLPPIGEDVDTSHFFDRATLSITIHALHGSPDVPLEPEFTNAGGGHSIAVHDDYYMALWDVSATTKRNKQVKDVRVEVWATGLEGSALEEACRGIDRCLVGSFDATFERPKRGAASNLLYLSRARTLPIKIYIRGAGGEAPEAITDLRTLADPTTTFSDVGDNCPVNEFTMPGQGLNALGSGLNALGSGLNALGSVGGLFLLGDGPTGGEEIRLFEPEEAGLLANGLVDQALDRNAVILVVDDFGDTYELGDAVTNPLWPTDPDEAAAATFLGDLVSSGGFSHGALVMHQMERMAEGAGFNRENSPDDFRIFSRWEWGVPHFLIVAAVDTNSFNADVIAQHIESALAGIRFINDQLYARSSDPTSAEPDRARGYRQIAVNMSFAIVPCAVLEDFETFNASGTATFDDYVAALGADNDVAEAFYDDLKGLLSTPLGSGPLQELLVQCADASQEQLAFNEPEYTDEYGEGPPSLPAFPGDPEMDWQAVVDWGLSEGMFPAWDCSAAGSAIVYVASSGNFGLDARMYPAAWNAVVATSSQNATGNGFAASRSSFSNGGQVMAPGALYELSATTGNAIAYAGTSFSAPVVSLFTALDMMNFSPTCALADRSRLTETEPSADVPLSEAAACL